jgi:hypothetical protein
VENGRGGKGRVGDKREEIQRRLVPKSEANITKSILAAIYRGQTMDPWIKTSHALFDCNVAMTFLEGVL